MNKIYKVPITMAIILGMCLIISFLGMCGFWYEYLGEWGNYCLTGLVILGIVTVIILGLKY